MDVDLRSPKVSTWMQLKLPVAETLQSLVVTSGSKKQVVVSQGIAAGGVREDTVYSTHTDGVRDGVERWVAGGHGTLFGQHPDGELVRDFGGELLKSPFRPGKFTRAQLTWAKPYLPQFSKGYTLVDFDAEHGQILFRHKDGDQVTMLVRNLAEAEAGTDRIVGTPVVRNVSEPLDQGCGLYGNVLLHVTGHGKYDQLLTGYYVPTGEKLYSLPLVFGARVKQEPEDVCIRKGVAYIGQSFSHTESVIKKLTPRPLVELRLSA